MALKRNRKTDAGATCDAPVVAPEPAPIRILTRPRVDWLALAGYATPGECGFIDAHTAKGRPVLWRPGWWGKTMLVNGVQMLLCHADRADPASFAWPQAWAVGRLRPTRVDVCVDIEGFTFTQEHRSLFTMRKGKSRNHYSGETLETINIGGESSHVNMRLRIYLKSAQCTDADRIVWQRNGWSGGDVWRVEYQINERALPAGLRLPEDVGSLLTDALSRYRMCKVNPRTYAEQNKAPTHRVWEILQTMGTGGKLTRRRRQTAVVRRDDRVHVDALDRLMKTAGVLLLPRLYRRMQDAILASGGDLNGEGKGK